jgi:uncharacterized protein YndB with AHSA1/START domain
MSDTKGTAVERTVDLDVDRQELWALIATPEGWREWMVDDVVGDVVVDRGVVRRVRVDETHEGESIAFTWWEDGDPLSVSHVRLTIDDGRLQITEQLLGAPRSAEARLAWEVRVCSLWACTVAAALV